MTNELINAVANLMQVSVAFLSLIAYIPQWVKLVRKKSSNDISLRSWILWTISSVFAVFYAIVQLYNHGSGWALIISSVLSLVFVIYTVVLIIWYRKKSGRSVPA